MNANQINTLSTAVIAFATTISLMIATYYCLRSYTRKYSIYE